MPKLKTQSVVIIILALLLLPATLYILRVPLGFALLMILIPLCPCISAECRNCSCDTCVERVLIALLLIIVGVPLLLYLTRRRHKLK